MPEYRTDITGSTAQGAADTTRALRVTRDDDHAHLLITSGELPPATRYLGIQLDDEGTTALREALAEPEQLPTVRREGDELIVGAVHTRLAWPSRPPYIPDWQRRIDDHQRDIRRLRALIAFITAEQAEADAERAADIEVLRQLCIGTLPAIMEATPDSYRAVATRLYDAGVRAPQAAQEGSQ